MSAYNPPTRDSTIFNPEYFQTSLADLDTTYLNQNYLRFPFAQGLQNMQKINITDDTESSDVNSGSLVTAGGIGLGKNLNIGGQLRVNSQNITLGLDAGLTNQGTGGISIGEKSGKTNQGNYSFAMGLQAGETNQSYDCIALGSLTAQSGQGSGSIAIGAVAGQTSQGTNCVALGNSSGQTSQGNSSIAIGYGAGGNNLGTNTIAIGTDSNGTGIDSVAIGKDSTTSAYINSVALGTGATSTSNNQIILGGSSHTQVITPCVIKTTDDTTSTTTGSGSLQCGGGAGIVENLNVGGYINARGGLIQNRNNLTSLITPTNAFYGSFINFDSGIATDLSQNLPLASQTSQVRIYNSSSTTQTVNRSGSDVFAGCGYSSASTSISIRQFELVTLQSNGVGAWFLISHTSTVPGRRTLIRRRVGANISSATGSTTPITFDTAGTNNSANTGIVYDNTTGRFTNSRATNCSVVVSVSVTVSWDTDISGNRQIWFNHSNYGVTAFTIAAPVTGERTNMSNSAQFLLANNEYFTVEGKQNSGGNLNIVNTNTIISLIVLDSC